MNTEHTGKGMSRRDFLIGLGAVATTGALAACGVPAPPSTATTQIPDALRPPSGAAVAPKREIDKNGLITLAPDVKATPNLENAKDVVVFASGKPEELPNIAKSETADIKVPIEKATHSDTAIIGIQTPITIDSLLEHETEVQHYGKAADIALREIGDRDFTLVGFSTGENIVYSPIALKAKHITLFSPAFADTMVGFINTEPAKFFGFSTTADFVARAQKIYLKTGRTMDVIFGEMDTTTDPKAVETQIKTAIRKGDLDPHAIRITWVKDMIHAPKKDLLEDVLLHPKQ